MQQNIVFQAEQLDGPTLNFYYSVEVLEILQRNRFPVYFEVAVDVAGPLVCICWSFIPTLYSCPLFLSPFPTSLYPFGVFSPRIPTS